MFGVRCVVIVMVALLLCWVGLHSLQPEHRSIGDRWRDGRQAIRRRLWRGRAPRLVWTGGWHDGRGLVRVVGLPGLGRGRLGVAGRQDPVSYTHLRAHETDSYLVCRLLLEKKKKPYTIQKKNK